VLNLVNVEKYIKKSFYNPYLDSVAFEIRYPSLVRIIKNFEDFQESINEEYPNYGEGFPINLLSKELKAPENLRKINFSDDKEINKVKLSIDRISVITKEYESFDIFNQKVIYVMDKFLQFFNIKKARRIGLRYTNNFQLHEDYNESIELVKEMFNSFLNKELIRYNEIKQHDILIRKQVSENHFITLRNLFDFDSDISKYFHILDFDAYYQNDIKIEKYKEILNDLRNIEKEEFLKSIKENFINEMQNYNK
jgi:uncharacterized protein (TIGR04255 family)